MGIIKILDSFTKTFEWFLTTYEQQVVLESYMEVQTLLFTGLIRTKVEVLLYFSIFMKATVRPHSLAFRLIVQEVLEFLSMRGFGLRTFFFFANLSSNS